MCRNIFSYSLVSSLSSFPGYRFMCLILICWQQKACSYIHGDVFLHTQAGLGPRAVGCQPPTAAVLVHYAQRPRCNTLPSGLYPSYRRMSHASIHCAHQSMRRSNTHTSSAAVQRNVCKSLYFDQTSRNYYASNFFQRKHVHVP